MSIFLLYGSLLIFLLPKSNIRFFCILGEILFDAFLERPLLSEAFVVSKDNFLLFLSDNLNSPK